MVTYFNKKDLIGFGEYLLSEKRRELFKQNGKEGLKERLAQVHHADVENYLESIKRK